MSKQLKKELNKWIEERKKELKKAKTKFQENELNDWIEIPDYKISELNNFQRFLNTKTHKKWKKN